MSMPILEPIPIKTKGHPFHIQLWRWITAIRSWKVVENWHYNYNGHEYVIPKGFVFDGASIPRPLWFLLSPTGLLFIPGLIHDFGYRFTYLWEVDDTAECGYKKSLVCTKRGPWDVMFHQVSKEVNGTKIISALAHLALMIGGSKAWKDNRERDEQDICPNEGKCGCKSGS
ncbi:DUF1353 domain-containing protein [Enterovibrio sp. ZSDZ35]|uniref:DUF1353 domain-containing protein n=1 Tax=Enterovibrio qingdaonensis TaxID=2899818 RepID=A0ABT5QN74_9GAMM|nr:DUF1353 domain-containing protein [Enterovibrio sp. ZSDZ35]MDD1782438.1 DUF1353 domain-containing protein [Enterovibrio sp. ZSDZ35]